MIATAPTASTLAQWLPRASLEQIGVVALALAGHLQTAATTLPEGLLEGLRSKDLVERGRTLVRLCDGNLRSHDGELRLQLNHFLATPLTELGGGQSARGQSAQGVTATFETAPPLLPDGRPATFAGRHAGSVVGYAAWRALTGAANFVIGRGWLWGQSAADNTYTYDPQKMRGRFRFQYTPQPALATETTAPLHTKSFAKELAWAGGLREDRGRLHTDAGRQALNDAERQMLGIRREWRGLYNESVREWSQNPFTTKSPEEFARGHAATAERRLVRNERILQLILDGEKVEHGWQEQGYRDLIDVARRHGARRKEIASLEEALERYVAAADTYEGLLEKGLSYDPEVRGDYKVKKGEQATFMALWELHRLTQEVFQRIKHPDAAAALRAPLTFSARNQAYLLDGPGQGQPGLEPIFETVRLTRPGVKGAKRAMKDLLLDERLTPAARDELLATMEDGAVRTFGLPQLLAHFPQVTLAAPEGYPLFSCRDPDPAVLALVEGGLLMEASRGGEREKRGSVTHAPHMSTTDYAMALVFSYLLGDERISIVAEEAFRHLPVFGDYIDLGGGVFISRKEIAALREKMRQDISDRIQTLHRTVISYGTGTRLLGNILGNPHADLANPAVLYLPGESAIDRFMTGQPAVEAARNRVPLKVWAQNLLRGGAIEPSIPRGLGGFVKWYRTMFGHVRPGMGPAFAAMAGAIPPEALRTAHAPREDSNARRRAIQEDTALVREMGMWAAFGMDLGLTG